MSKSATVAPVTFDLENAATEPPEERGLARDETRLMVVDPGTIEQRRFHDLPDLLRPGDLVVVNTSATLPAAVDGFRAGKGAVVVHFATPLDDETWTVELRAPDASGPLLDGSAGEMIDLAGGGHIEVMGAYAGIEGRSRLLRVHPSVEGTVGSFLGRFGRPITYSYMTRSWPLAMYQTVFATEPGSAEMPSAGRPFSTELITRLLTGGVAIAPITLHSGVSSMESGEIPAPERFRVPAPTARLVNHTRRSGGLVVAVGTTVTRALETAADGWNHVTPREGWTDLILGPDRPARVVGGLITGWHAPEASHRHLLDAVAGAELVERAYETALRQNYLWHEFGDGALFLPRRRPVKL